jgi:hypothetical protein
VKRSEMELSENWWFTKCFFVVFVVAGCIVHVLAVVVSYIVVFLYCVCALFVCNVCCLSVVLLYYCHRVKAQLQFNKCLQRTALPVPDHSHSSARRVLKELAR